MKRVGQAADNLFKQIEERYTTVADDGTRGVDSVGLKSGMYKLDEELGGFRNGGLYILGGRTGMGKSALALGITDHIANMNKISYYLSFEMSAELLVLRLLSGISEVPSRNIELGRMTEQEYKKVKQAREIIDEYKFVIDDDRITSFQLKDRLDKVSHVLGGLDFAAIDYLSLFTDISDQEVQRLEGIVGRVSEATSVFDIPMLGLVQLNRATTTQEDSLPTLSNIRYSDRISHDAFAAFFVHRPQYYNKPPITPEYEEDAMIVLDKNRMGRTGNLKALFYPKQMRWEQKEEHATEPQPMTQAAKVKQAKK